MRNYKGKDIAIVGLSNYKLYKNNIPQSFKVWTLNVGCIVIDNIDLLFDMHDWVNCTIDVPAYYNILKTKKFQKKQDYYIIKSSKDSSLKGVKPYPINEIIESYGYNLKNSIPEMILYAWYIGGVENIFLYGISDDEFRAYPEMGFSLYQAIGFVRAKGINVFVLTDSVMNIDDDIYGYYKLTPSRMKLEFAKRGKE